MASAESTSTVLPPCRRYISTHDSDGKSTFHSASDVPQLYHDVTLGRISRSFAVSSVPATLTDNVDVSAYLSKTGENSHLRRAIVQPNGQGVNLLIVDIAPGGKGQMHRTVTVDFAICVMGRIGMILDSEVEVELKPSVSPNLPASGVFSARTEFICLTGSCHSTWDHAPVGQRFRL